MPNSSQPSDRVDAAVQALLRSTLIDYRTRHDLSRSRFAERVGLSLWMISMFEKGDRQLSLDGALRVCHAMDVKLWELLKEVEE